MFSFTTLVIVDSSKTKKGTATFRLNLIIPLHLPQFGTDANVNVSIEEHVLIVDFFIH